MIYPHKVNLSWGGSVELEARDLSEWAAAQPLSWTITSGQGSILDPSGIKVQFVGPDAGPDVPLNTVLHLFAGESAEIVGECTITFDVPLMDPALLRDLPREPEPDPPPEENEIEVPVECCADPEDPSKPLKITPVEVSMGPDENLYIRIPKIHSDCERGCYTWRIAYGGGRLLCDCGPRAIYRSPSLNRQCENNALIELICDTIPIAHTYVTINTHGAGAIAYETFEHQVD